ncbi:hypothetical protein [Arthrobacter sp. UYEF3]|uniref:hypothetical protein n=1 Tax=Arthrobacter sp. UYEF3 TaxID=1756365 RepID=UPI00339690B8
MSRPIRVELGSGAVWTGILVTHASFCVLFSAWTLFLTPSAVGFSFLPVAALLVGAIPAVVIGWAAVARGAPLRRFPAVSTLRSVFPAGNRRNGAGIAGRNPSGARRR